MTDFEQLIIRYADGRDICNCGQAYYENCGEGMIDGERRYNIKACRFGCSSNQINAKDYVAKRVLEELINPC